jgi:hypothetical protein
MGQLAPLRRTCTVLSKVRTFPDVLLVAVQAFLAITKDSKVTTDTEPRTHIDMRKWTLFAGATTLVQEVKAERRAFRCWVMGKTAGFGSIGTIVLKEVPAYGYLGRIMLIHACQPTVACSCRCETRTWLVRILA